MLSAPESKAFVVLEPYPRTVYTSRNRTPVLGKRSAEQVGVGADKMEDGCKGMPGVESEKLDACDAVEAVQTLLFGNEQDANARPGMVTKWVAK
jgi:hypothetical protein